ncbi:Tetraspanin-8 [Nymphaea thermarum]|nr:Tetraspanin-8 [Nymphaea thermarum]
MGFLSNNLLGILNFLAFLLSIPILAGGIWLSRSAGTACEEFLDKPLTALGVFLLLLSLAGLIGACCRVKVLLWIYLFVMFVLIVLVFCFTVFALAVTNKGAGEVVSGRGYKDYRLGDYSNWLQKRVSNEGNWKRIKSCLQEGKVCQSMVAGVSMPQAQFYAQHLSPIQLLSGYSFGVLQLVSIRLDNKGEGFVAYDFPLDVHLLLETAIVN